MAVAYSEERRSEVLALYCEVGVNETVRLTGVSRRTVYRWASEADLGTVPMEKIAAAQHAAQVTWSYRRAAEALEAGTDAQEAREQMMRLVAEGKMGDAVKLVAIYGVLIDKAQMLSGGATKNADRTAYEWDEEMDRLADDLATRV